MLGDDGSVNINEGSDQNGGENLFDSNDFDNDANETNDESDSQDSREDASSSDQKSEMSSDKDSSNDSKSRPEFFVDYEIASSRGNHRRLWGLSNVTRKQFYETKHLSCDELMPLEDEDFRHDDLYMEYYREEILNLSSMNEDDGVDVLLDFFNDHLCGKNQNNSEIVPVRPCL